MTNFEASMSLEKPERPLSIAVGIVLNDPEEALIPTLQSALALSRRVFVVSPEPDRYADFFEENAITHIVAKECDDDSVPRNALLDRLETENQDSWLLWLRPGETFDETTRGEFQAFLENEIDDNSIYVMVLHRLTRPDRRRHDLDEETIEARLMPLGKGLRFEGRLRPSLMTSAADLMIGLSATPGRILCPPKLSDPVLNRRFGERNLRILSDMEKMGEKITEEKLALRAESYALIGDHATARRNFLRLIEETTQPNLRLPAYYDLWETFTFSPIAAEEMTKILLVGLDHFPVDMQLLTFMGAHLQRLGKLDIAARTFETAVRYGQISLDVWHRLRIREIAVTSHALVERLRGRPGEAIRIFETNLETIDDRSEFNRHLMDIYIAEQMEKKAKEFAATVWGDVELDRMRNVITGACRASAGKWEEAIGPLEKAFDHGCRDPLCLRWLSLTLLSLLRFPKAIDILGHWIAVEPTNTEAHSYLFAAQHPESFGEIIEKIQKARLNSLGIAEAELFKKGEKKEEPRKDRRSIDNAVREMISASGTGGKIRGFKPLRDPKPKDADSDVETKAER